MYYDQAGKVRATGAEAMSEGIYEQAEDEGWFKVEWFSSLCSAPHTMIIDVHIAF